MVDTDQYDAEAEHAHNVRTGEHIFKKVLVVSLKEAQDEIDQLKAEILLLVEPEINAGQRQEMEELRERLKAAQQIMFEIDELSTMRREKRDD